MKQPLYKVMNCSTVFKKLSGKHFSNFQTSYKIAKAYKEIEANKEFYLGEEKKLIEQYAMRDEKGNIIFKNNQIFFKTPEDNKAFNEAIEKLQQTEVDVFEPIRLTEVDLRGPNADISPLDIIALEDFVIFDFGEEKKPEIKEKAEEA